MKFQIGSTFLFLIVSILLNAQQLTYVNSSEGLNIPALEGGRTELEFADINQDGHIDILSIGDHGSPYINTQEHGIMVWFGDGYGNWTVHQEGNFGYGGIAIGDVNNDGYLDVGYGMHHNYSSTDLGDQLIEVALGDGTGMNWIPWDNGLATNGETWGMFGTDFADVNNDGFLDLGSISFGAGAGVHIYLNQTNGTWMQSFGFLNGNSSMIINFGDINNDGNNDFAVTHQFGTVYFGDGTGNFTLMDQNLPPTGSIGRYGTSLGDVDNNGGKDLAFCNSNGGVEVWCWDDTNGEWDDWSGNLPSTANYDASQLFDMNMDGYMDVTAFGEGIFTLWLGDGLGTWIQDAQFFTPPYGYFQAFRTGGDIDHNGYPDIVLVAEEGSWPNYQNHLYCYKESSIAENLNIMPDSPSDYMKLKAGSIQFIDWISAIPENDPSYVKLEYSVMGIAGPWIMIEDNLPNNGRFQWKIPQENSTQCHIRYSVYAEGDSTFSVSPTSFTIMGTTIINNNHKDSGISVLNCFPNPSDGMVNISFNVDRLNPVTLEIISHDGKLVFNNTIIPLAPGLNHYTWNGRDMISNHVSAGIFYIRLKTAKSMISSKIVILQ